MILILSNERDITSDYIVRELQRRGMLHFRLNSERLPSSRVRCFWSSGRPHWEVVLEDRSFRTSQVSAAYFRRPGLPVIPSSVTDKAEARYCLEEWRAVLRSIYTSLDHCWLNSPANIARAEDKALQLALAAQVGLRVPATVITNNLDRALELKEDTIVGKAFHTGFIEDADGEPERVMFTTRLGALSAAARDSLSLAPVTFQQEIVKSCDIRVTVVGRKVFAASIDSQIKLETAVDWRRGSHPDLPHARHPLPDEVASKCVSLLGFLGLKFAAIDLVLDKAGDYWFLESNPNGQWAWIEHRTGLPISSAIVDELVNIPSVQVGGRE